MEIPSISSVPRTVEDIFKGFSARHSAIVHALTSDVEELFFLCNPDSSFMPPLIYSVLGSSGDLAVGPISISSLVMGSMLREVISPEKEPIIYIQLAFTATFFAGVFQASLGLLSAAVIVSLQQLKGLFGIVHFTNKMGFIPIMLSIFKHKNELCLKIDRFLSSKLDAGRLHCMGTKLSLRSSTA